MPGKLSPAQEAVLLNLYRGHPFGIDHRTERGLRARGFVETGYWNEMFPEMPALTIAGAREAQLLDVEQRTAAGVRHVEGTRFGIVTGGLA